MNEVTTKDMLEGLRGSPIQVDGIQGSSTRRLTKKELGSEFSSFQLRCAASRGITIADLRKTAVESRAWIAKFQAQVRADMVERGLIKERDDSVPF